MVYNSLVDHMTQQKQLCIHNGHSIPIDFFNRMAQMEFKMYG